MVASIPYDAMGENHVDIAKSEKRIVRISTKNFDATGFYYFIKLFKQSQGEFMQKQYTCLTTKEAEKLRDYLNKTLEQPAKKKKTDKLADDNAAFVTPISKPNTA